MRHRSPPDRQIAAIAARQGGVVSRAQLRTVGLSPEAIGRRVDAGRLHIIHRGVYAVGHRSLGVAGRRWAAVLACGDGAVLSHASAADAWELRPASGAAQHVSVPRPARVRRPGIRVHSPRSLPADEVTRLGGLPITTAARTLLDLASTGLRGRPLERALDQAERRRRIDWEAVRTLLERYPRRRGSRVLSVTLSRYVPGTVETLSELEEIVLGLCDQFAIPRPKVNALIEGNRRDFYWPHRRVVVEADSYAWHRSPSALNDDRERDVRLQLAGFIALRFTYEQCTERREYVRHSILVALDVA